MAEKLHKGHLAPLNAATSKVMVTSPQMQSERGGERVSKDYMDNPAVSHWK